MPCPPSPQDFQLPPRSRARRNNKAAATWSVLFTAVLLGSIFASDLPHAAAPREVTPQTVQHVVEQQLQALAVEDANRAFALADPDLRTQFGNAQDFMTTLREKYPMLMRPQSVLFLKPETDGTIAMQKVRVTDGSGSAWSLTYLLNRQQDDQWRISGCVVTPEGPRILT